MDKIREALEYAAEWHSDCYYTQEKAKEALALMSESKNSDAQDLALELAYGVWEPNTLYEGARNAWLRDAYVIIERYAAERERKAREEYAANAHKMIEACKAAVHTWTLRGQSGGVDKRYANMDKIKEATK